MIPKPRGPAALANTALMILRNRLSERVWGAHGVHTLRLGNPRPHVSGGIAIVGRRPRRKRLAPVAAREARRELPSRAAAPSGIGVIGDSISDEYRFYAPDRARARNWVEILASTRGLHFGDPVVAGRARRFAFNWSQSGATTSSLIARGQHSGLAAQIAGGAPIGLAAVTIGTNDFADVLFRSKTVAAMDRARARAASNFAAILGSLLGARPGLKVAAFTAVDLRSSPLLRGAIDSGLISRGLAGAYSRAVAEYNEGLLEVADRHGGRVAVVDINGLLAGIVGARRYVVGSIDLDRAGAGNGPGHLFLADGFHPGTVGQCMIANRFLAAIGLGTGTAIGLLGTEEVARVAASVPRPSGLSLIGTGVLALLGYGRRRPGAA